MKCITMLVLVAGLVACAQADGLLGDCGLLHLNLDNLTKQLQADLAKAVCRVKETATEGKNVILAPDFINNASKALGCCTPTPSDSSICQALKSTATKTQQEVAKILIDFCKKNGSDDCQSQGILDL